MQFLFHDDRLERFKMLARPGAWPEKTPSSWTRSIGIADLSPGISNTLLTRCFLKRASLSTEVTDRDMLWAVLAWGRMRRDAARRLRENEKTWINLVGCLRRQGWTRAESFARCSKEANRLRAGGIGPAYFTKLIFFANPRHDGYIMDQWTSRSVNFLVKAAPTVRMRTIYHVDPRNTECAFENYCRIVEGLSHVISKTPEETEQCLFSTGGRKPDDWRRFLKENGG